MVEEGGKSRDFRGKADLWRKGGEADSRLK
jgi:hypothetical protein